MTTTHYNSNSLEKFIISVMVSDIESIVVAVVLLRPGNMLTLWLPTDNWAPVPPHAVHTGSSAGLHTRPCQAAGRKVATLEVTLQLKVSLQSSKFISHPSPAPLSYHVYLDINEDRDSIRPDWVQCQYTMVMMTWVCEMMVTGQCEWHNHDMGLHGCNNNNPT